MRPTDFDNVADLRAAPEPAQHVPAECRVGFLVDLQGELFVDVGHKRKAVDLGGSIRKLANRRGSAGAEISTELAHDPFHDALECHEAGGPAVFIDHDRLVRTVAPHLAQQFVGLHRLGHR